MFLMVMFLMVFIIVPLLAIPCLVYKKLKIDHETDQNVKRYYRKYKNSKRRK